jgi:mannonate dehydratase
MERLETAERMEAGDIVFNADRREFVKLALGGVLGGAAMLPSAGTASAAVHKSAPGIKLCAQTSPKPTDEELLFLKQIGAEYVSVQSTPDLRTAEGLHADQEALCGCRDYCLEHWEHGRS